MQTVIISGGSDGLGRALAQQLKAKYQVIILSPTADKVEKVAQQLGVDYQVCDVSQYQQCVDVVGHVVRKYGTVDHLINNAGIWIEGELEENDPAWIEQVVRVNALGPVFLTKAAIPVMKKQGYGTILNVNSQAGFYAKEKRTVYTLTKWAVTGFTKSLQPELAKYGIRVTDIHPGKMVTNLFDRVGIKKDLSDALDPVYVAEIIEAILQLPKEVVIPELGIKYIKN